jgi:Surface adhesin CshA non-repetitive domain 2
MMRLILGVFMLSAAPALAATCSAAAAQGSAPPAWQTYCWLDFTDYNDTTARSVAGQNISYTLSDGATLSFNIKTTPAGAPGVVSATAPSWVGAAVGNSAFIGIPGRPILYQSAAGTVTITFSNITITPPPGTPAVTAYAFVAADAESTNNGESLSFTTNGTGWTILDQVEPRSGNSYPTIAGVGTSTFTETGVAGTVGGFIVGSNSPTTVSTTLVGGGLQGAMFAVRFASIRLNKILTGGRVDPSDQFKFDIRATSGGALLATGTSTGTGPGPFNAAAVSLASGIPITISEAMAAGSASAITKYVSRLTCVNGTAGSTTVVPTNVSTLSYSFGSLQFGDAIQCTFYNTAFPHLRLQKALGAGGRIFDTDQFRMRIFEGSVTTASTTTTGTGSTVLTGATAMTQVTAGTAYSLVESASGTTVLSQYTAVRQCVNNYAASATVLPSNTTSTITPQMGDVITCTITNTKKAGNAVLTVLKSSAPFSDPANGTTVPKAIPGADMRYSISVANSGSLGVTTDTLEIIDRIPTNMVYNSGVAATFTNGTIASGLSFNAANDVKFSNSTTGPPANFAACTYTPVTAYDPAITYVCVRPTGAMAAASVAGQPSFTITFRARIN